MMSNATLAAHFVVQYARGDETNIGSGRFGFCFRLRFGFSFANRFAIRNRSRLPSAWGFPDRRIRADLEVIITFGPMACGTLNLSTFGPLAYRNINLGIFGPIGHRNVWGLFAIFGFCRCGAGGGILRKTRESLGVQDSSL